MRCEGYRRHGGAFSLGPIKWVQCENDAIAMIIVVQDGETGTFPSCAVCWQECIDKKVYIDDIRPILPEGKQG